jgi:hypothetical protein
VDSWDDLYRQPTRKMQRTKVGWAIPVSGAQGECRMLYGTNIELALSGSYPHYTTKLAFGVKAHSIGV